MATMTKCGVLVIAIGALLGCNDNPEPKVITIKADPPPLFLAYRHADETTWLAIPVEDKTDFEITVRDPYLVALGCETGLFEADVEDVEITAFARTLTDSTLITDPCRRHRLHQITGSLDEPGSVTFDSVTGITGGTGSFGIPNDPGTCDLVLRRGNRTAGFTHIGVRRDVTVTGDLDLGMISLAQEEMHPFESVAFSAQNALPNEQLSSRGVAFIGGSVLGWSPLPDAGPWELPVAPAAVMRAGDRHELALFATQDKAANAPFQQRSRGASIRVPVGEALPSAPVELPPVITDAAFERSPSAIKATFAALPAHTSASVDRFSTFADNSAFLTHTLTATSAFLAATTPNQLAIDFNDVPGFQPQWGLDPDVIEFYDLSVTEETASGPRFTTIGEQNLPDPPELTHSLDGDEPTLETVRAARLERLRGRRD